MSYLRVIPRDLFNEANLLKCLGRLWCLLDETRGHNARLGDKDNEHSGAAFDIVQDESDGAIFVHNLPFTVGRIEYTLFVPLNSRAPWPLWLHYEDDDIQVFNEAGSFSTDFQHLILGLRK